MSDYQIEIITADKSKNETGFSGYFKRFHIITEGETIGEIIKNIFDNIPAEVLNIKQKEFPKFKIKIKKP